MSCKGGLFHFEEYQRDTCATGACCLSAMEIRDYADGKSSILIIIPADDEYCTEENLGMFGVGGNVWLPI